MMGTPRSRPAMIASALKFGLSPTRLSFTGAMQALKEIAGSPRFGGGGSRQQWENLLEPIAELRLGNRPGRQHPRELKRRAKKYKLMRDPRDPDRNRYATGA
ncbi:hypothetical protein Mal65_27700 [Crateriforma conspicua]|nr:hypothetical protein Mal65_27700 [Crateriforma conspicua]